MAISFGKYKRIVVKIGSSLLTNEGRGLDAKSIADWAGQVVALQKKGYQIVIVSSGAVAQGIHLLGWRNRPKAIYKLQAAAAVGQVGLVESYGQAFNRYGARISQVLLTHDDLSDRTRYLNARSTITELLSLGIIPIVNENDTVATAEIQFGDNDTLAALVTNLIDGDILIILTDQDGLYSMDPRGNIHAELIGDGLAGDIDLEKMAGSNPGSHVGSGGMLTKILAAKRAARGGAHTIITSGRVPKVLTRLAEGEKIGTALKSSMIRLDAKRKWLADNLRIEGTLIIDDGAKLALCLQGKSLLPVGVSRVRGLFKRGDLVKCCTTEGNEVARGLTNYASSEAEQIVGRSSSEIKNILGYVAEDELIHRDNLVIL